MSVHIRTLFDMRVLIGIVVLLLIVSQAVAFGNDDHWVFGSGQGFDEAVVTHGPGNSIFVSCNRGATKPGGTGIEISIGGTPVNGPLTLIFDGTRPVSLYTGVIRTDNRAGISSYQVIME